MCHVKFKLEQEVCQFWDVRRPDLARPDLELTLIDLYKVMGWMSTTIISGRVYKGSQIKI